MTFQWYNIKIFFRKDISTISGVWKIKIQFQFNSRSSGQGVPEAIQLAKKCSGFLEGNFYKINFDSPTDNNLSKILQLVGRLKGSIITINNGEPVNATKFINTFQCQQRLLCKGVCSHVMFGYYDLREFNISNSRDIEDKVLTINDNYMVERLSDFLEDIGDNRFKVDKDLLAMYFFDMTEFEGNYCSKYNKDEINKELQKFPNEIKLETHEERYDDGFEDQLTVEISPENALVFNSEIDNQLPILEILKVCEAISLVHYSRQTYLTIHNSNIQIYHYPNSKKYVLLRTIKKSLEMDNETTGLVSKKNNLFYFKDANFDIYFQLVEKEDPRIEEYSRTLSNI